MMTQVGIHDNDKIAICMFDAVNICRAQAQFRCSWPQQDFIFSVNLLQLLGNIQGPVRAAIVDDNNLKVQITAVKTQFNSINYVATVPSFRSKTECLGHTFHSCI